MDLAQTVGFHMHNECQNAGITVNIADAAKHRVRFR